MIKILIVDDHLSVMEGTKALLELGGEYEATTAASGTEMLECMRRQQYDLLLVDMVMPGLQGVELVAEILSVDPEAVIVIYTGYDIEPHFNRLMEAGISGFVSKTASKQQLFAVIRSALNRETLVPTAFFRSLRRVGGLPAAHANSLPDLALGEKEMAILRLLAQGSSNKEIAEIMFTSQRTLEYTLTQLFHKLNVKSRKEAVRRAKSLGWLTPSDFL